MPTLLPLCYLHTHGSCGSTLFHIPPFASSFAHTYTPATTGFVCVPSYISRSFRFTFVYFTFATPTHLHLFLVTVRPSLDFLLLFLVTLRYSFAYTPDGFLVPFSFLISFRCRTLPLLVLWSSFLVCSFHVCSSPECFLSLVQVSSPCLFWNIPLPH